MDEFLDQWMEDHLNGGYGDVLDQVAAEECADDFDEPWDEMLAQQELEEFEKADEYFGCYGGDEEW